MPMEIRLVMLGALKAKAPADGKLQLEEGASIEDVLQQLDLSEHEFQIVMVNGKPKPDRSYSVSDNDELTIIAPVGGG